MLRGRYRVIEKLGAGAMGTVFAVEDMLAGGARLALKALWTSGGSGEVEVSSLRSEFRVLATLHHPSLCRVYDFGRIPAGSDLDPSGGAGFFYTRDLVEGVDLATAAARASADLGVVCRLFADAARALDILHRAGMRHGDFKPKNVIVRDDGAVRLIDFGLTTGERSGVGGGTVAYMAPEVLAGGAVDRRSDLYALGIALYELTCGHHPSRNSDVGIVEWHRRGQRPSLKASRPDASVSFSDLVGRLISIDPEERLASGGEVAAALDAATKRHGSAPRIVRAPLIVPPIATETVADLERAYEARRAGHGDALVEVVGETGAGKSTALKEFCWRVELSGAEVVRCEAQPDGRPFGAIAAVLEQVAALTGSPPPQHADDETAVMRFGRIAQWLATVSRQWPLVIVVDDLDFADEGTRKLVEYLAVALPDDSQVLIVASRSDQDGSSPVSSDRESLSATRVSCRPLTTSEVAVLIESVAGRADNRLAVRVHQHTSGNLLHIVHTLEVLHERGFPPAESLRAVDLPPRLKESIAAQLERAGDTERLLYEVLSVLAAPSDEHRVAAVFEAAGVEGRPELSVSTRWLTVDSARRWSLTGAAVRQHVYETLDDVRRQSLHSAVANTLRSDVDTSRAEIMHHDIAAGDRVRVAGGIEDAADELERAGDKVGARDLLLQALPLIDDSVLVSKVRLRLGEVARLLADAELADRMLTPLIEDVSTSTDHRARALLALGRALDVAGQVERAQTLLRALFDELPDAPQAVTAARELVRNLVRHGKSTEALELIDRALARDPSEAARLHLGAARAYAVGTRGNAKQATAELDEFAVKAAELGDSGLEAAALNFAALLSLRSLDYRRARDNYLRALRAAERVGDVVLIGVVRVNLASLAILLGDYAGSLGHHRAAVALLSAAGSDINATIARKNYGHLLLEIGEFEQARVELSRALAAASRLDLSVHVVGTNALLGILAWRTGDLAGGRKMLVTAARRFGDLDDGRRRVATLLDVAELELDAAVDDPARLDDVRAALEEASSLAATKEDTDRRGRYLALRAELASRDGDSTGCRQHVADLSHVIEQVRAEGGRHLEWTLHHFAADALDRIGDRDATDRHRSRALSILDAIASDLSHSRRNSFWQDPRRRRLRGSRSSRLVTEAHGSTILSGSDPSWVVSRLYRLLGIYRQLSSERDSERLLELVMDTAIELSGADRGFLLLAEGNALVTAVARNLPAAAVRAMKRADTDPDSVRGDRLLYSRSIAEQVFRTGEPVVSIDAAHDPRFEVARSVHALALETVICVPVHAHGRVAGALYLESRLRGRPVSDDEMKLLLAFGDQVAVLLGNARLLDENRSRAEQLEEARHEIEALLAERTELLERRTEELAVVRRDLAGVNRRFLGAHGAFGIIGKSLEMERVFQMIERLSATDVPVLVLGESGTGKELVARALHQYGPRSDKTMVAINCGALPVSILESELFGHVRGSFTGADRDRRGLFETASGGTLFLDEIGETPMRMQTSLLRALQEKVIRPVGATVDVNVDVRVVAATNRSLEAMVAEGTFREDLFYRLHVVPLYLPPLRDRDGDIPLLLEHFLARIADRTGLSKKGITRAGLRRLIDYSWPGNVRQLEHALTNACVMADGDVLDAHDFDSALSSGKPVQVVSPVRVAPATSADHAAQEKREILAALEACAWNKSKAARMMEMPRRTFYRRLTQYDIQ